MKTGNKKDNEDYIQNILRLWAKMSAKVVEKWFTSSPDFPMAYHNKFLSQNISLTHLFRNLSLLQHDADIVKY